MAEPPPLPLPFFFFFLCFPRSSISIASSLVGEDAKTKFLSKMGQLTTSSAMLANVFQRKKWAPRGFFSVRRRRGGGKKEEKKKRKKKKRNKSVPLNVDEKSSVVDPLTRLEGCADSFPFLSLFFFVQEDAFGLRTFTTFGRKRSERAPDGDTGQYLDSPKKEKKEKKNRDCKTRRTWTHRGVQIEPPARPGSLGRVFGRRAPRNGLNVSPTWSYEKKKKKRSVLPLRHRSVSVFVLIASIL